jgi:hypothetical protein
VTYDEEKETWVLVNDYVYVEEDGTRLMAPAGFEFDLSSVPRVFWIFIAPNELSLVAPLFHDLIYQYRGDLPDGLVEPDRLFTREDADRLFLHLMEPEGVPLCGAARLPTVPCDSSAVFTGQRSGFEPG